MGFFTDGELGSLSIVRMNFQVVGEDSFVPRPAMTTVEQPDFFLDRIREIDVASAYRFQEHSDTKQAVEHIAAGTTRFANGAVSLARSFDSRHVGQSSPGAFFFFELQAPNDATKLYAMLKYDYSEVLTLRRAGGSEQLRKILQAFVKDKKALQKSAVIRVVGGVAEALVGVKDRAARAPNITDFFTRFLGVERDRDDIELNKAASEALVEIVKAAPEGTWSVPAGDVLRALRDSLRSSAEISEDAIFNAVWVNAGRPDGDADVEQLRAITTRAIRRRKLTGLSFPPNASVFRAASKRKIRTVENIKVEYPDELEGVNVSIDQLSNGGARITITTERIDTNEIVNESIGNVRRQVD